MKIILDTNPAIRFIIVNDLEVYCYEVDNQNFVKLFIAKNDIITLKFSNKVTQSELREFFKEAFILDQNVYMKLYGVVDIIKLYVRDGDKINRLI